MIKLAGFCCKGKYFQLCRQIISITISKPWGTSYVKPTRVYLNEWVWQSPNKTLFAWTNDRSDFAEATVCHLPLDTYKSKEWNGTKRGLLSLIIEMDLHFLYLSFFTSKQENACKFQFPGFQVLTSTGT